MSQTLDPIQRILAEKARLEKEFRKAEQQYLKIADQAIAELKSTILKMCSAAGTSIEELFGIKADAPPVKKTRKRADAPKAPKGAPRKRGPGKYILKKKVYDGRQARAVKGFDVVRVDGKIDDVKAIEAGMINPAWLASGSVVVKRFIDEHKLDVSKIAAGA